MIDRSLLSQAPVIEASKAYICIRPLTYEDRMESDYLRQIFAPRGFLENTVFAIMDPKASKYLAGPGRGPEWSFPGCETDPSIMAKGMRSLALTTEPVAVPKSLPSSGDLRFALNVAACDNLPLAIVVGDEGQQVTIGEQLAKLAWSDEFWGQWIYGRARVDGLQKIDRVKPASGVLFVEPDEFGTKAKILGFCANPGNAVALRKSMGEARSKFKPLDHSDHRGHLQRGVSAKVRWKSVVPVEDQQADQAAKRLWGG